MPNPTPPPALPRAHAPWLAIAASVHPQGAMSDPWTVELSESIREPPTVDVTKRRAVLSASMHPQAIADRVLALLQARWGARWDQPYLRTGNLRTGSVTLVTPNESAVWFKASWGRYIAPADIGRVQLLAQRETPELLELRAHGLMFTRDMLPNDWLDEETVEWFLRHLGLPQATLALDILTPEDREALTVAVANIGEPLGSPMWSVLVASRFDEIPDQSRRRREAEVSRAAEAAEAAEAERAPPCACPECTAARKAAEKKLADGPPGEGFRWEAAAARQLRALGTDRKSLAELESSAAWRRSGELIPSPVALTRRQPAIKRGRCYAARETGVIPRYMHRWAVDGAIFGERIRRASGVVLLDWSGSMSLRSPQVEELLHLAPAATLATYSGTQDIGDLRILVRRGRMASRSAIRATHGGNVVDFRALCWLAHQRGPRYWISDGGVSGKNDESADVIQRGCGTILKHHLIRQFGSIDELLAHFRIQYRR